LPPPAPHPPPRLRGPMHPARGITAGVAEGGRRLQLAEGPYRAFLRAKDNGQQQEQHRHYPQQSQRVDGRHSESVPTSPPISRIHADLRKQKARPRRRGVAEKSKNSPQMLADERRF